ncbi:MAG: low temperature requirement protein A [Actinomycetota bacterium]|nr:low temperature requirement protein A [Actinomycetota bacterium]
MTETRSHLRMEASSEDASVTPLELFFDLVFVFGLTQVTALMAADLTVSGLVRGLLVLGLLWWSWTGYAWLANVVRADEGAARIAMLAAMAAMFVLALSIPEAFFDEPGGLNGPMVVGLCYFAFRALHLLLFWIIAEGDEGLRHQLVRFTPSVIGGTALLLIASQLEGTPQTVLWGAALLADYGGTLLAGASGWRLRSAGHFAERHGLIVIVALGESIVAIGVGMAGLAISWPILVAAVVGLMLAAGLWWMYFDITSLVAERALADEMDDDRPRLARDAYSFLHLPLIAGVVLLALGMKKLLEYVGDTEHHELTDPLTGIGLYALYGGVALYLVAHAAFKLRATHILSIQRLVAAAVVLVLLPLGARLPALGALVVLTAVVVGLVAFESVHFAEDRNRIRHEGAAHHSSGAVEHS